MKPQTLKRKPRLHLNIEIGPGNKSRVKKVFITTRAHRSYVWADEKQDRLLHKTEYFVWNSSATAAAKKFCKKQGWKDVKVL